MDAKLLAPAGWTSAISKCQKQIKDLAKGKDAAFQKALDAYDGIPEDKFDECLKALPPITKAATELKKMVDAAKLTDVAKYLTNVVAAAAEAQRNITQKKAQAEKLATATAKKDAADAKKAESEEG